MDAVRNRVILQSNKFMVLISSDVDHVRRGELGGNTIHRHLQPAFSKQRQVIELMCMTKLNVPSVLEVHHARKQVGDAANRDGWEVAHRTACGMVLCGVLVREASTGKPA